MFGQVPHAVQAGVADPGVVGAALDLGQVALRAPAAEGLVEFGPVPDPVAVVRVPRPGLAGPYRWGQATPAISPDPVSESQVQGLLKAERHALGVDTLQLLIAQARTRLGEAVPAVARRQFRPRNTHPVKKRLRGAVQHNCLRTPVIRSPSISTPSTVKGARTSAPACAAASTRTLSRTVRRGA